MPNRSNTMANGNTTHTSPTGVKLTSKNAGKVYRQVYTADDERDQDISGLSDEQIAAAVMSVPGDGVDDDVHAKRLDAIEAIQSEEQEPLQDTRSAVAVDPTRLAA